MIQIVRCRYPLVTKFPTDLKSDYSAKSVATIGGEVNLRIVQSRDLGRR
jgi:hypothetical protein